MLSEKFFSPADTQKIEQLREKFKKFSRLLLIIGIPMDIGIAYIASLNSPELFLPISIVLLVFLGLMYYLIFVRGLRSFDKDLSEQMKLAGELLVKSKTVQKNIFIIHFESEELKSIGVSKKAYDQVNTGDKLSIEASKHSRTVFKLHKNEVDLLQE